MAGKSRARRHVPFYLVIAALAVATAAAQADATSAPRGETGPVEVKIISTEFRFLPAKLWVVAGRPVTLVLDNSGAETEHDIFVPALGFHLVAIAGEMPAKVSVPAGRAVALVLDNTAAETEHGVIVPAIGFRLQAKTGEIVRRTIVFDKPGEYDFFCDLPGHSEAGMWGKLIVR
jgi:uncharacterized cupredoxin-like copper-binding protein